jgi:two-component system cell cycle sensor histidine kinase PleC
MARAETASASLRSDSIKGLAQSIANPAYRRLLTAEPVLRRAVPVLIVAFMLTICIGAAVQVLEHRRQVILDSIRTSEALADHLATALDRTARDGRPTLPRNSEALTRTLPVWAAGAGRSILIADVDGAIIASVPNDPSKVGRHILDVLGPTQPLPTANTTGTTENMLPDGDAVFATMRALRNPIGFLAVVQPRSEALASWRSTTALTVTLSATTGFVVLILGFAFHWQATRAREADLIHDTVRYRIDTALNRGRCGLWDWDLARGRVFWSHSMFDILGLPPKDDLLTFGEVSALVHRDDINLYELATQVADCKVQAVDHAFRMRHADGRWLWLRARCELARQEGECGLHLIGIAVDITEQKILVERTMAATCGCATPSRPSRKPSCSGTPTIAWCCAIRTFRNCITFPTRRCRSARATRASSPPAKNRSCAPRWPTTTSSPPAPEPSKSSSTTAAGCISANGAPRTAATFRSAPILRR